MQVRDQRGLELIGTGAGPLAVTGDGVDLTVVRQVAERLSQRPAWNGVGGEALVEQANGRFQTQVRQVQVEARQVSAVSVTALFWILLSRAEIWFFSAFLSEIVTLASGALKARADQQRYLEQLAWRLSDEN